MGKGRDEHTLASKGLGPSAREREGRGTVTVAAHVCTDQTLLATHDDDDEDSLDTALVTAFAFTSVTVTVPIRRPVRTYQTEPSRRHT